MSQKQATGDLAEASRKRVEDSFSAQAMMKTLGATLDQLGNGTCRIVSPILPGCTQQHGYAHAALTFAIGDSAAGYAALTLMDDSHEVLTAEMKINLLAPARGDRLVAEGRVLKPGRRLMVTRSDVFAETGSDRRHVATLLGTMVPVDR